MSEFKNPIPADKIPHSPQMSRKMASSLLERHFFLLICIAPPQAGRDVGTQ